jgi:putative transposase
MFAIVTRKGRVDLADAIHHVAALAVDGQTTFHEDADRTRLLEQLARVTALYDWTCQAYCLMGTHFHLIVHTPRPNLSAGMQHLCGPYAQWFNWKYHRRGHLFARRFASAHITHDSHLLEAHRYVALNPVRARLCSKPERWPWGSYRALCGLEDAPSFLHVEPVLGMFGADTQRAHGAFRAFVLAGLAADEQVAEKAGV